MPAFTKDQKVTLIGSWDDNGTFYFVDAIVHSCGAKRLILTGERSGAELGRNYRPQVGDIDCLPEFFKAEHVVPRLSHDDAKSACINLAEKYLARAVASCEANMQRHSSDESYKSSMRSRMAKLHEPRFHHLVK